MTHVQLIQERRWRKYYQNHLLKFTRDLKFFEGDPKKLEVFQGIDEDEDELMNQARIQLDLKGLDLSQEIIEHVEIFHDFKYKIELYEKELKIMRHDRDENKAKLDTLKLGYKAERERFREMMQQIENNKQKGGSSMALQRSVMSNLMEDELLNVFKK